MSLLSAADLTSMRATLDESLPSTAAISRKTLASDGQGGRTETWATVATVACRVSPMETRGDDEQVQSDRPLSVGDFVITFPAGTDVRAVDRCIVDSVTYEVVKPKPRESYELCLRADAVVVD